MRFYRNTLSASEITELYNSGKGDLPSAGDFSNPSSKISGTKGTAITPVTISAAFTSPYYEAINLPPGLTINNTTGEIAGTPTVGGVGSITIVARNADGKRAVTTIPYDSESSGPLYDFPGVSPASDHAVMMGEITHSGGEENTVDLIWGTNATVIGSTIFLPSSNNLALWLDASDNTTVTHSSNAVSQWSDKSGQANHLLQSDSNKKPAYSNNGLNSLPTLSFDGTSDYLELADGSPTFGTTDLDSSSSDKWTVFAVGQAGTQSVYHSGVGRGSAFLGKAGGWGDGGTFILGLLTHDGSNSALTTPRWLVQQRGWAGSASGAMNNNNWT